MYVDSFIYLYLQLRNYLFPSQVQGNQNQSNTTPNQAAMTPRIHSRRRNRHRFKNRYRRINLGNNYTRGNIILRARQITQQNRQIAIQSEQDLVNAILQARDEQEFFTSRSVRITNNSVESVDPEAV